MEPRFSHDFNCHRFAPRAKRGFLVIDAMVGIAICLLLLMALSATITRQAHAERRLSAVRAGAHDTETAMLTLQAGDKPPAEAKIERLPDAAPAGFAWVRLAMPAAGDVPGESIVGLVPRGIAANVAATQPEGGLRP